MIKEQTFSSTFIGNKTGSIRAMFYNIYGYRYENDGLVSAPKELRQQMQAELISEYAPDLIGFQEYSVRYHTGMTPLLTEVGYTEVDAYHTETDSKGRKINCTPLFYREDSLSLLDKGFHMYTETMPDPANEGKTLNINDARSKSITWAVFEEKQTGKRFIAVSTHFMYNAWWLTREQVRAVRTQNAEDLLAVVEKIKTKGEYAELPVIMGGDLNGRQGEAFLDTLKAGGMEWLYELSPVKNDSSGIHEYALYDKETGELVKCVDPVEDPYRTIDYVFVHKGTKADSVSISAYIAITDKNALLSSDHCPRFADITLK